MWRIVASRPPGAPRCGGAVDRLPRIFALTPGSRGAGHDCSANGADSRQSCDDLGVEFIDQSPDEEESPTPFREGLGEVVGPIRNHDGVSTVVLDLDDDIWTGYRSS